MLARKFSALLNRFREAQQGMVAIWCAAAMIPACGAAGAALDYMRASQIQTRLQSAMDAAALAAATSTTLSNAQRIRLANKVFTANWTTNNTAGIVAKPEFELRGQTLRGHITVDVETSLMKLAGFANMPVNSDVTINLGEARNAEVVLVLDYSGSMNRPPAKGGEVKYVAMRKAAIGLVDDLAGAAPGRVKVGLVPFSHHVYATMPKKFIAGQGLTGSWTGCTQDRKYPFNTEDKTPVLTDDNTKWGQPQAPAHVKWGCGPYLTNNLVVRPLTDDFAAVTGQLEDMLPYQYTHIALGVEFGLHLLSPNEPFSEGTGYGDKTTDKIMVVLTDGEQTEESFGPGGSRTVADGESNLESLCTLAKAQGITMMTIAYDLNDDATTTRLRNCASDPAKTFFKAEDNGDVTAAFEGIKHQVAAIAYISR